MSPCNPQIDVYLIMLKSSGRLFYYSTNSKWNNFIVIHSLYNLFVTHVHARKEYHSFVFIMNIGQFLYSLVNIYYPVARYIQLLTRQYNHMFRKAFNANFEG